MVKIGNVEIHGPLTLAPMAGVTDAPFRALCRAQGRDAPAAAPVMEELDEEVPYDELFVRECFPYGLAALLIAEDDRTMFNWLMSEYERPAAYYAPCTLTDLQEADE